MDKVGLEVDPERRSQRKKNVKRAQSSIILCTYFDFESALSKITIKENNFSSGRAIWK